MKATTNRAICGELGTQHLHRDDTTELKVPRLVHSTHRAGRDFAHELIAMTEDDG